MDNRPIGVFDSGLGGLTAVRRLAALLPNENIIYFGDTGRVPYGTRSREIIRRYAMQDVNFLRSFDLKAIVIACGTVSSIALDDLRAQTDLPIFGVVFPTAKRAAQVTKNGRVGIIATPATIRTGAYDRVIRAENPNVTLTARSCPLFVPLVENSRYRVGDCVVETVAREYLEPLKAEGIDTLILGCTHYPLLEEVVAKIMGPDVTLVDSGAQAARQLRDSLARHDSLCGERQGGIVLYASDITGDFGALAPQFLREPVPQVLEVDIDKY